MATFSITNGTRGSLPRVPFSVIKEKIIGKRYTLSLTFIGDTRMRTLNQTYRKKEGTTDILSFPLGNDSGEIVISQKEAARRAKHFNMTTREYLTFLFIHGLLHLKGCTHGASMEKLENKWCAKFGIQAPYT